MNLDEILKVTKNVFNNAKSFFKNFQSSDDLILDKILFSIDYVVYWYDYRDDVGGIPHQGEMQMNDFLEWYNNLEIKNE